LLAYRARPTSILLFIGLAAKFLQMIRFGFGFHIDLLLLDADDELVEPKISNDLNIITFIFLPSGEGLSISNE